MRGIPGSGKSTVSSYLVGTEGHSHSTDNYFMDEHGHYNFDFNLLNENHKKNFEAFCESVKKGTPVVICDNTNMREDYYYHYAKFAQEHGYIVSVVETLLPNFDEAAKRNSHGVTSDIMERMWS